MNRTLSYIFLFVLGVAEGLSAQSGCPGCILELPPALPQDTIYLSETPNATFNQAYEADLSFRLPMTTTPVANNGGNVPPNLNIASIEILDVLNLPPGLSWEASDSFFEVIDGETDGCVRFCGTPIAVDSFSIEVVLQANLFISQETSVFVPLIVEPATSSNDGFSLINNEGCGSVTVEFINNVPSNGQDGFNYLWDFGDGTFATSENPNPQIYTIPGQYEVAYEAVIDTTGFFLTNVLVEETSCTDLFGTLPDLKINVFDPSGALLYTAPIVENTTTPVNYVTFIELGTGIYTVQVVDDDNGAGGADDDCGTVPFTRNTPGQYTVGDLTLTIGITHPTDTTRGLDTVTVYAVPNAPVFSNLEVTTICPEDSVRLEVLNYVEAISWFLDSNALNLPDTQTVLYANIPGNYMVTYTSPDGCQSSALAPVFDLFDPLDTVLIENFGNLIQADSGSISADAGFSWELNGTPIDEERFRFCAVESGLYTLVIIDPLTRCHSRSSIFVEVDPDISCDITAVAEWAVEANWSVYPNPSPDGWHFAATFNNPATLKFELFDLTGRSVYTLADFTPAGNYTTFLRPSRLSAGMYFLTVESDGAVLTVPLVKR